jgi:hypothetical protein
MCIWEAVIGARNYAILRFFSVFQSFKPLFYPISVIC